MLNKNTYLSSLNPTDILKFSDWIVFSLILLITLLLIIWGQQQKKQNKNSWSLIDYFLMGRKLTLPFFVATLVATWYGGIFGVTQIAFEYGIYNFLTQGIFWYVTYIIFALFLVPHLKKYKAITLPELVEQMFGPRSGKLSALFNFFNVVPISYTISLGLFSQMIFGGSLLLNMILGTGFILIYSMSGGMRSVVYSDLAQFFVMCLGVFLVLLFSVGQFGGLTFLQQNLPPSHFSPLGGNSLLTTFVWGFIALSTLVDPNFYQRCFAASNTQVAKKGIIFSTCIWFCFDICTTFGAMYARAVIPAAESSTAYLTYSLQILPEGFRGLLLAGVLATIMSTIDSYLLIAGTTLSYDIFGLKKKSRAWKHHASLIFVAILSIVMALIFDGNIKFAWKTLGSYSASCLLFPMLFGYIFPGKISDKEFFISSLGGVLAVTSWKIWGHLTPWAFLDKLYIGLMATSSLLLFFLFIKKSSFDTPKKDK